MHTPDAASAFNFTAAVFYSMGEGWQLDLMVVHLESDTEESLSAEAVARGYSYAGVCAVVNGVPRVEIQASCAVVIAAAGPVVATLLGTALQAHQLQASARIDWQPSEKG